MEGARRLAIHYMRCPTKEIRAPSAVFGFPKSKIQSPKSKLAVPLPGSQDPKSKLAPSHPEILSLRQLSRKIVDGDAGDRR